MSYDVIDRDGSRDRIPNERLKELAIEHFESALREAEENSRFGEVGVRISFQNGIFGRYSLERTTTHN